MELWQGVIEKFMEQCKGNGVLQARRRDQTLSWVYSMVEEHLQNLFYRAPEIVACRGGIEDAVIEGRLTPTLAVQQFINTFTQTALGDQAKKTPLFELK